MTYAAQPNSDTIRIFNAANRNGGVRIPNLLIVGDSRANSLAQNQSFSSLGYAAGNVLNMAVGGTTIADNIWAFLSGSSGGALMNHAALGMADRVLIVCGINTIHGTSTAADVIKDHMKELHDVIAPLVLPTARFYVVQIYRALYSDVQNYTDQRVSDTNAYLSGSVVTQGYWKFCAVTGDDPTNTTDFPDGVHPSAAWEAANVMPSIATQFAS